MGFVKEPNDLISVIIPAYGVETYLDQAIKSVVNQTYKNLEIILVDDESPDRCGEICEEWAAKDSRIRVIHKKNGGISSARNAGLDVATGDFIGFVDGDDYIDSRMYELLHKAILRQHSNLAGCYEMAFREDAIYKAPSLEDIDRDFERALEVEGHQTYIRHYLEDFTGHLTWVWNKLYARSVIGDIRFVEGKKMEDIVFSADVAANVWSCAWVKERMYFYRQREGSIMNTQDERLLIDYCDAVMHEHEVFESKEDSRFVEAHLRKTLSVLSNLRLQAYQKGFAEAEGYLATGYRVIYDKENKLIKEDKMKYWMYRNKWTEFAMIRSLKK